MAVLATGISRLTGIGGALFLVSDIVLAVEFFVAPGAIPYALFVNMALYLPAQLMITLGVLAAGLGGGRVVGGRPGSVTDMQTRTLGPFTVSAIGLGGMPMSMNNDHVLPQRGRRLRHHPRRPGRRRHLHRHRRHLRAVVGHDGSQRDADRQGPAGLRRQSSTAWSSAPRAASPAARARPGAGTARWPICVPRWRSRCATWGSSRSISTSGTGLIAGMVYGEVIGHFKTLQDEGKIKAIGISNANVEEIQVAIDVLGEGGLASVQNEFSPRFRCSTDTLEFCGEHGVAFLPWSPLGGTGGGGREVGDRFAAFGEIAADHGVSPQQVVLAWELSLGDHVIPIPGARRPASITDSAQATRPACSAPRSSSAARPRPARTEPTMSSRSG